jgi:hypothetical protein
VTKKRSNGLAQTDQIDVQIGQVSDKLQNNSKFVGQERTPQPHRIPDPKLRAAGCAHL